MAAISCACPECDFSLQVPDESLLGQNARCPNCQSRFVLQATTIMEAPQKPEHQSTKLANNAAQTETDPDETYRPPEHRKTRTENPSWLKLIDERYELLDRLGGGGFGVVWKARDVRLDRIVALKLPRHEFFDDDTARQTQREAQAAARLKHPNIVSVFEVKNEGESIYIVSEYIEGITLTEWMEGQPVSSRQAAEFVRTLAETIHHAHEAGIVHRDIKPGNVLVDAAGELHITDFGLAKRDDMESSMSEAGRPMGTPAYMSPEQARGESRLADRRTDIYSTGVMLFELLTGDRPFRGKKWGALQYQILTQEPPKPRSLNPDVPSDLDTICLKCLEKDPDRRYRTSKELAEELTRFLNNEPILARPIGRTARFWRACKRQPVIASLIALLVVVLLAGSVISTHFGVEANLRASEADDAKNEAVAERDKAQQNEKRAIEAEEGLRTETNRFRVQQARQNVAEGWRQLELNSDNNAAEAFWPEHLLWFARAMELSPKGSEEERINRMRVASALSRNPLEDFWPEVRFATFSPDGKRIATTSDDGEVAVYETETHKRLAKLRASHLPMVYAAFSSDGNRLAAVGYHKKATVWNVDTGEILFETPELKKPPVFTAFHPQEETLFVLCHEGLLERFSPNVKTNPQRPASNKKYKVLALSPDTKRALATIDETTAVILDSLSGAQIGEAMSHSIPIQGGVFSPDSRLVATYTEDRTVKEEIQVPRPYGKNQAAQQNNSAPPVPSAEPREEVKKNDEKKGGKDFEVQIVSFNISFVQAWSVETGTARTEALACYCPIQTMAFDPSGKSLAVGGGELQERVRSRHSLDAVPKSLPTERGPESNVRQRAGTPVPLRQVEPRGQPEGTILLWSLQDRDPDPHTQTTSQRVQSLAFSSDGRNLISAAASFTNQFSEVQSWSVENDQLFRDHPVWPVNFFPTRVVLSQQGNRVLVSGTEFERAGARMWNLDHSIVQGKLESSATSGMAVFNEEDQSIQGGETNGSGAFLSTWNASNLTKIDQRPLTEPVREVTRTIFQTVFEERVREYTVYKNFRAEKRQQSYKVVRQLPVTITKTAFPWFQAEQEAWDRECVMNLDQTTAELSKESNKSVIGVSPKQDQLIRREDEGGFLRGQGQTRSLRIVDAKTGKPISRTMPVPGEIAMVRMDPKQRLLVVVTDQGGPSSPAPVPLAPSSGDAPLPAHRDFDEQLLANVMVWDLETSRLVMPLFWFPERPGQLIQFDSNSQRFLVKFSSGLYLFDLLPSWLPSSEELMLLTKWASYHDFDATGTVGDIDPKAVNAAWEKLVR